MKKGKPEKSNESIAMSRKAYNRSGKKPHGDISNLAPKRNKKKKKQPTGLKVSVVAEEDEQIGEEWFLHDHQKCIDCQSQPDLGDYYFKDFNDLSNWPTHVTSHMVLESADPEPKEMPSDLLLYEKEMADRHRRLDQRIADSQRMVLELELEAERAERAEMADRHRMKLEAEMADLEDQSPSEDEELKWSPVNFMFKEDLSP